MPLTELTNTVARLSMDTDLMLDRIQGQLTSLHTTFRKAEAHVVGQEQTVARLHDLPLDALGGLLKELARYRTDPRERAVLRMCGKYMERTLDKGPPTGENVTT